LTESDRFIRDVVPALQSDVPCPWEISTVALRRVRTARRVMRARPGAWRQSRIPT